MSFDLDLLISAAGLMLALAVSAVGLRRRARLPGFQAAALTEGEHFRRTRQHQSAENDRLYTLALTEFAQHRVRLDLPLLTLPGWIPDTPIPLDAVVLDWVSPPGPDIADSIAKAKQLWPRDGSGEHLPDYVSAIYEHDKPEPEYFNGASFRLLDVSPGTPLTLQLTHGWYFDALNTTEALGFEAATEDLRHPGSIVGPYRRALTNPFALGRRCAIPGISVLTLGRGPEGETRFYLHKRSGERVSVARNVFHVAPAGEFQPADISREALADDFDLWRSIMREYAEEFFGVEDARGRSGRALDYDHRWPMSALQSAKGAGDLKLHFLGLGLDPLTWKPEILVAAVFERETFTEVFADLQTHNEEGTLILGQDGYGIRFDSAAVSRYGEQSGTLAAGQAAIALAWSHRDVLGI